MRTIAGGSAAFLTRLRSDHVNITELIELTTINNTYRWTTCNATLISSGHVFDPFPGGTPNGGPEEGTDLAVGNINFLISRSGDMGQLSNVYQLELAQVHVRRVFIDTPDLGSLTIFKAKLADYTYNRDTLTGNARNLFGDMQGSDFPPYIYADNCVWRFGGQGCTINTNSFTFNGSLNVASSSQISVTAASGSIVRSYAAGALERGRITFTSGVNSGQMRSIRANSGDAIDMSNTLPFSIDPGGVTFAVFPGCRKRLITDCVSKYNNAKNFFGVQWMPTQELVF